MRHIFIINPVAGGGKAQKEIADAVHSLLKDGSTDYEIYFTKFKGDAENFIKARYSEHVPSVFYACGGDGTLHEVVNAACGLDNISIGIIPCGSGNDFVKNLDGYSNFQSIQSQIDGQSIDLDLIKINNKYAVSVCNIGLDADAAFNMHKFKKLPFVSGSGRYYLSVLYCLLSKLGKDLEVVINENEILRGSFLLGVMANGHSYGGGYKCAPLASVNDGIMDLCFVDKLSRFKIMSVIGSYKKGTHLINPKVNKYISYFKCRHVKMTGKEQLNVCIDGEGYTYDEVDVSVAKGALKFWMPKGTEIQQVKELSQ